MDILIDGRSFVHPSAGITTFARCCINAWAKRRPEDTFIVALPRDLDKTFSLQSMERNIKFVIKSNWLLSRLPNLVWLCTYMPVLARKYKADVYFSPFPCIPFLLPRKITKIIVVHDVVNLEYKETMQLSNIISNKLFFNRSVVQADLIWTNSYYTKGKIDKYFPQRKCRNIFIGCSNDDDYFHPIQMTETEKDEIRQRYGIRKQFLLFVGSMEPRKNLKFLLQLMPEVYQKFDTQLVVVGAKGWKNTKLKDIVDNDTFPKESIIFCGYVPTPDLPKLYCLAASFISCALNEGFGMPQLEALKCGCPVITSHNSAMIEVVADKKGALTVKGYEKVDWLNAIERMLTTHPRVDFAQLKNYDWQVIMDRFLQIPLK